MPQPTEPSKAQGGLSGLAIKSGVMMCLAAIIFGLIVMVAGVLLGKGGGEDETPEIPEVFMWMASSACGLFTLGALVAMIAWLVRATSED